MGFGNFRPEFRMSQQNQKSISFEKFSPKTANVQEKSGARFQNSVAFVYHFTATH
jgi:hypothetical protein